jgi:hypothetical protein
VDDSRFDAWTRRTFGAATATLIGSAIALTRMDAEARKKRKKKKKRCLRVNDSCNPNAGKKCCGDRACAPALFSTTSARCCNAQGSPCSPATAGNCCSGVCNQDPNQGAVDQCFCKPTGGACSSNTHCCSNNCNLGTNQCV